MKELPAISVIIPLYNAEKYIGECLESLLAQTFNDFEVIVVDDCSTDNSVEIVKSYAPKFNDRIQIIKLKNKSNGGGSLPRNKGIEISRGEYIFLLDSDDAITPTAFEELYPIAKKFKADVVHCEKFYQIPGEIWHDEQKRRQIKPDNYFTHRLLNVKEPTPLTNDISKRVQMFAKKILIWNFWAQLIRRDFIMENDIKLPDAAAQDMLFTMCEFCCAKNYLIVPNAINFYRVRNNSVTTEKIDDTIKIHKWINTIKLSIRYLDKFLSNQAEFSNRPDLKYVLFDTLIRQMIEGVDTIYLNVPIYKLDEFLRKEFCDGDNVALMTFAFSTMNLYRLQMHKVRQELFRSNQIAIRFQQRIKELETELNQLKNKE